MDPSGIFLPHQQNAVTRLPLGGAVAGEAVRTMTPDPSTMRWRKSSYSSGQGGDCVELACLEGARWQSPATPAGRTARALSWPMPARCATARTPGPALLADLLGIVGAVKAGLLGL
jgi:Domain of unknown function (DUF397)